MLDAVLAAVQVTSTDDVAANLRRCRELVRAAAADGATLVGLPENFAYLGSDTDHRLSIAEALPSGGPILAAMQELAREAGTWLLLGGFPERDPGASARIRNTSLLLDPGGQVTATYRKIH